MLKEVKLVDRLFKYKQCQVYMPQGKLTLSFLKMNMIVPLPAIELKQKTAIEWCQGGTIGGA